MPFAGDNNKWANEGADVLSHVESKSLFTNWSKIMHHGRYMQNMQHQHQGWCNNSQAGALKLHLLVLKLKLTIAFPEENDRVCLPMFHGLEPGLAAFWPTLYSSNLKMAIWLGVRAELRSWWQHRIAVKIDIAIWYLIDNGERRYRPTLSCKPVNAALAAQWKAGHFYTSELNFMPFYRIESSGCHCCAGWILNSGCNFLPACLWGRSEHGWLESSTFGNSRRSVFFLRHFYRVDAFRHDGWNSGTVAEQWAPEASVRFSMTL